jgi:hypothetical protein
MIAGWFNVSLSCTKKSHFVNIVLHKKTKKCKNELFADAKHMKKASRPVSWLLGG